MTKTTPQQERENWKEELMDDFCVMFERAEREVEPIDWVERMEDFIERVLAQRESEIREVVVCAAVLASDGTVYRGHRHRHAMQAARDEKKKLHEGTIQQGFITSRNRYVSRVEARKLQDAAGILSADREGYRGSTLFSEDLYQPDKDVLLQALTPSE